MFSLVTDEWANPLYSHGYIVPIFALALMWMRFQPFRPVPAVERWIGLGVFVLGLAVRHFGVYMTMNPLDRYSFLIVDLRSVHVGRRLAHDPLGLAGARVLGLHVSAAVGPGAQHSCGGCRRSPAFAARSSCRRWAWPPFARAT